MQKETESKLINFLSKLDKKHVDELIDILTDFGKGRIALNNKVKDVLLFEKEISTASSYCPEFIKLIITEFQLFSGNSLVNQFRKDPISYEEVLNDVYTHLIEDNPYHYSMSKKEEAILLKLLGSEWKIFDFNERLEKSTAFEIIFKPNLDKNIGLAGLFAISRRMVNIAGAAATTIFAFSTEAYRIMIPFVLQISWLKMKYGFYDNNGLPIKMDESDRNKEDRKIDEKHISTLNQLIGCIPSLLIQKEVSQNNIAVLDIPLEKLKEAKDENGLRAFIMGDKGIERNARIFEPEKLRKLVNTGVLINLASTLVAQKHLADINQKLNNINEGIENIKKFLEDERESKIIVAYEDVNQVYSSLLKGEKDTGLCDLNIHIYPLKVINEHIQKDIKKLIHKIKFLKNIQDKNKLELFKKINQYCEELKLCCNTQIAVYSVLFMVNKEQCNLNNINYLCENIKSFLNESSRKLNEYLDNLLEKSRSIFNLNSTDLSNSSFVRNRKFDFDKNISSYLKDLELFSKSLLESKSAKIQVELENGKIKEAYF